MGRHRRHARGAHLNLASSSPSAPAAAGRDGDLRQVALAGRRRLIEEGSKARLPLLLQAEVENWPRAIMEIGKQ